MAGLDSYFLSLDAVGSGPVVHPVGTDRGLAGLGGSSWVGRAGRGCSHLGFVAESRRRGCSGVVVGGCFERACRSQFGVEIVCKVVAGSMMKLVGRMLMQVEAGITGSGFAGHRQAWRIDWTVGRGMMGFVDCNRLVGGCTECFQEPGYLVAACCGRADRDGHGDG